MHSTEPVSARHWPTRPEVNQLGTILPGSLAGRVDGLVDRPARRPYAPAHPAMRSRDNPPILAYRRVNEMSYGSLGIYRPQRNWGTRVREVIYKGMQLIELENESLRIGVLAGKGPDVIEFSFKPQVLDFAWLTSGGVRNTAGNLPSNPGPI